MDAISSSPLGARGRSYNSIANNTIKNQGYQFHNDDIQYVISKIRQDNPDTTQKRKLLKLLAELQRQLYSNTADRHNIRITLDDILQLIVKMKLTDCRHGRGSIRRAPFWTLTMAQALISIVLSQYTTKRWLRYQLRYVTSLLPPNWLRLYHRHPNSIVYYMYNTDNKENYIGESEHWMTRFFSEITDANKLTKMFKYNDHPKYQSEISYRKAKYPYAIRVMQRQGTEKWISIPIMNLTNDSHADTRRITRKRHEKLLIRSLNPSMNTKGFTRERFDKYKSQRRHRPPIAIRKMKKMCPEHNTPLSQCSHDCWIAQRKPPIPSLAVYTVQNRTTKPHTTTTLQALDVFFQNQKRNQKLSITRNDGQHDLTNWNNMKFYHKNLQGPHAFDINALRRAIRRHHKVGFTLYTTGEDYQRFIDRGIHKLAKFQHAWRAQLAKASTETLFDLLYRCSTVLTEPKQASRATYRIWSEIRRKSGMRVMPKFVISFPYDHRVDKNALKQSIYTLIDNSPITATLRHHIKLQLRIVNTKRKTIADIMTNTKLACKSFNPKRVPTCIQHPQ